MTEINPRFFRAIQTGFGTPQFFAARTPQVMRQCVRKRNNFTEIEPLSPEAICRELNPFVGPHFVDIVPEEFENRPGALVLQFPDEALRDE